MRAMLRLLLAMLLLAPVAAGAQDMPRERILSFVSDVHIARNGDLDVTETIRVLALGQEIRRGIQRDFPTRYSTALGQRVSVGFTILSVQRDGQDEHHALLDLSNGVRVRIGQADVMLPPGEHVYAIRYRTTRQIHYGGDSDELYWNATGTGWTFPIDVAEARITLPSPAPFGARAVYTGPQGATLHDAEVIAERPGYIAFRTTRPLGPAEGLTVAAAFPKGVLEAPDGGRRLGWWLQDWAALATAIAAFVGLIAYYVRAWLKAGRNPRPGTVVPLFTPPDDLDPAACRYIARMAFDDRAFTAAIVDLGVRGRLHIDQADGGWFSKGTTTLSRTEGEARKAPPAPEAAMRDALFAEGESIALKQANHKRLQAARTALQTGLQSAYEGTMFRTNSGWAIAGVFAMILAIMLIAMVGILTNPGGTIPGQIWIALAMPALLLLAWGLWTLARPRKGCLGALIWGFFGLALLGAAVAGFVTFVAAIDNGIYAVFLPLALLPLVVSAFWWIYAPTREGRAVMDRIAGFRHYLGIAEEDRLEALHPPEKTPELFERYLPYAIALDVENRWAARFARVLAAAAAAGGTAQGLAWYSGRGNMWDDAGGFARDVGSALASTVSSASATPGSSSGSSGGGSSGGGGGGGGGSGW